MKSKDKLLENSKSCVENKSVSLTPKSLCRYVSENYEKDPEVAEVNEQRKSNNDDYSESGFADELFTSGSQLAKIDNYIEEVMKLPARVENSGNHENCKQGFDRSMLNSSPYEHQKYNLSAKMNRKNNVNLNEDTGKIAMANPDSTIEDGMFPKRNFSQNPKRQKKDDHYATSFEVFPQKSIKWRSPLIHSPAEKFSPQKSEFRFDFGRKEANGGNNNRSIFGTQDTTSSSMNSTPFDISEKPLIDSLSGKGAKKKSKLQFPLRDEDYVEKGNQSFNRKLKELDEICDLEYFNLSKKRKEQLDNSSASSKSYVGKYYNQLVMNSQREPEQTDLKLEEKTQNKHVTSTQIIEKDLPAQENEQEYQDNFMAPAESFQFLEPRQKEPILSEHNTQNYYNPQSYSQPVPIEYYQNHPSSNFSGRSCVAITDAVSSVRKSNPVDYLLNANFTDKYFNRHNFYPYLEQSRPTMPASPYFHHHSWERPPDVLPRVATSSSCSCMCCGHRSASYPGVNPYYDPYMESRRGPKHCWNHVDNIPRDNPAPTYRSRFDDIPEGYIESNCLQQLDAQPLRFTSSLPYSNYTDHETFATNAQIPEDFASSVSNLNCEGTQRGENANPNPFYQDESSCKYTEATFDPNINNAHHLGNHSQESQTSRRNVSQIFAPTPKRQLRHSPRFNNYSANKQSIVPKNVHIRPSQPISAQKRLLNFKSFEERLDNMILPRSQGYSFAATRDSQHLLPPPSGFNRNSYENGDREFVMNRFLAENNQRRTQ